MSYPRDVRRILCIRPDGIGDMVCATPAFASLRAAYPDAHLAVLASPLNAPVLEYNPDISEVIRYDHRGDDASWLKFARFVRLVRRERYDLAIVFRTAADINLLAWLSGAKRRVGYAEKPFHRTLTRACRGGYERGVFHEIDRNQRLLDTLGIPAVTRKPKMVRSAAERAFAEKWLVERGIGTCRRIGVHVGASTGDRCYPEERYATVASALAKELAGNACVLTFGGPADEARARFLLSRLDVNGVAALGLSIRQMAALFAECHLLLVNDSGPMHVGAALDVPLVALFGPGDHVRWMPESPSARLVRPNPPSRDLADIPVEWVLAAGRDLLRNARATNSQRRASECAALG